jgi:hypothetical protein
MMIDNPMDAAGKLLELFGIDRNLLGVSLRGIKGRSCVEDSDV